MDLSHEGQTLGTLPAIGIDNWLSVLIIDPGNVGYKRVTDLGTLSTHNY